MSPRLKAIANYHRMFRRLIRESVSFPDDSAEADLYLTAATIAYTALQAEVRLSIGKREPQ